MFDIVFLPAARNYIKKIKDKKLKKGSMVPAFKL